MSDVERKAEAIVDELAEKADPKEASKLDGQFHAKLARLEESGDASSELIEHLRLFWSMVNAPDDIVSLKAKTLIMAGLSYWVAPLDVIPDFAGQAGYMDDAAVMRLIARRISSDIEKFEASGE